MKPFIACIHTERVILCQCNLTHTHCINLVQQGPYTEYFMDKVWPQHQPTRVPLYCCGLCTVTLKQVNRPKLCVRQYYNNRTLQEVFNSSSSRYSRDWTLATVCLHHLAHQDPFMNSWCRPGKTCDVCIQWLIAYHVHQPSNPDTHRSRDCFSCCYLHLKLGC